MVRLFAYAGLMAALGVSGCGGSQHDTAHSAPIVRFNTVNNEAAPVVYDFVAQTQSSRQVNIHARVAGFLDHRVYIEGSPVKVGDVLFRIAPKPFKVQLDQMQAVLQGSKSRCTTQKRISLE